MTYQLPGAASLSASNLVSAARTAGTENPFDLERLWHADVERIGPTKCSDRAMRQIAWTAAGALAEPRRRSVLLPKKYIIGHRTVPIRGPSTVPEPPPQELWRMAVATAGSRSPVDGWTIFIRRWPVHQGVDHDMDAEIWRPAIVAGMVVFVTLSALTDVSLIGIWRDFLIAMWRGR